MKLSKMILLLMFISIFTGQLNAQVSVGINIGVPTPRYYYLQDIESYYDNQNSMYIYMSGGRWIHARNLPASYGSYDFNNGHRIIIRDYNGSRPYNYIREHMVNFPKGHYNSPEKNYWSYKEHRGQSHINRPPNRNVNKYPQKDGNNHNGNGRDKGHGNEKWTWT